MTAIRRGPPGARSAHRRGKGHGEGGEEQTSKRQLQCHGLFYARKPKGGGRQLCRNQLVIEFCDIKPNKRTLLLFFMNPGAGSPLDGAAAERVPFVTRACQIPALAVCLPTIPDATQAQTVLLMEALDCWRAVVVNLSDVCEPKSDALCPRVAALTNNTPRWDSLLHALRRTELNNLLAAGPYVAMIGGWGTLSSKQECLRSAAREVRAHFQGIVGAPPAKSSYRIPGLLHPRPTDRGRPKPGDYMRWRQVIASKLNLSQQDQVALSARRAIDVLVDKGRIFTRVGGDRLAIDLSLAKAPRTDLKGD